MVNKARKATVNSVPDNERYIELTVYTLDENYNTMS
jgi:hypothetical protein